MKKFLTIFCLFACALAVQAQPASVKAQVAQIRKQYAEAKERISQPYEDEHLRNCMTVTSKSMEPAIGGQTVTYKFYFVKEYNEKYGFYGSNLYLITRGYNVAPRKYYEEYLFDKEGNLIFAYLNGDDPDTGAKTDQRYYLNADEKIVWKELKNTKEALPATDLVHEAQKYRNAFLILKGETE